MCVVKGARACAKLWTVCGAVCLCMLRDDGRRAASVRLCLAKVWAPAKAAQLVE
jgi:hypothetical protein